MPCTVHSIETFFNQLPRLNQKIEENIFYRGQSSVDYNISPSVYREPFLGKEDKIYAEIMTECASEFSECKSHNEILSKMQHYGVPSRLLDTTTNSLVALYFACCGDELKDGVVYIIRTEKAKIKRFDSDVVSILACLPRFDDLQKNEICNLAHIAHSEIIENFQKKDSIIMKFNKNKCVRLLLHEIKKEKPAFENVINPSDLLANYHFIPGKLNQRIIRQSGTFIIFGLGEKELLINNIYDEQTKYSNASYKIIIDSRSKSTIIDQLSCVGISKATLHPELYKVAEHVKEKYISKPWL